MIKYILRKPLFPLLLLIMVLFDVLFMGSLRRGIERDMQTVEDMYDNAVVTFEALPGGGGSALNFRPHFAENIEEMEEVERVYRAMTCPYSLISPETVLKNGMLYGTNDAVWFGKSQGLAVRWAEGAEPVDGIVADWTDNDGAIPCIADEAMLESEGLRLGDSFTIAPFDRQVPDNPNLPEMVLYIVGCYGNETEILERNSLIVPECIFLAAPTILCNWRLMSAYCGYTQYKVEIKKEYNHDVDEIEDKMLDALTRAQVLVHSDVRVLKKAVRPVEQRLKIQKALEGPLEIALCVATALMAVLMAIGVQDDVFLFMLWGEPRAVVFLKTWVNLAGIILGAALIAGAAGLIVLGTGWLGWMLNYLETIALLCAAGAAIPVLVFCNKNLVLFYQTKEA